MKRDSLEMNKAALYRTRTNKKITRGGGKERGGKKAEQNWDEIARAAGLYMRVACLCERGSCLPGGVGMHLHKHPPVSGGACVLGAPGKGNPLQTPSTIYGRE